MPYTYSTLLPNYNQGHIIGRQLTSIFSQEKVPDQVIVCDDGSTDNSLEILAEFQKRYPALEIVEQKPNQGLHAAIDRLLSLATGDYLSFSASDDEVCPGFCAETDRWLNRYPHIPIVFGQVCMTDESGNILSVVGPTGLNESMMLDPEGYRQKIFAVESVLFGFSPSFFVRREVFLRHGGWPKEIDLYSDTLLNQIVALEGGCIYVHQPFTRFQVSDGQNSAKLLRSPQRIKSMINQVSLLLSGPQYSGLFSPAMINEWTTRLHRDFKARAFYQRGLVIYQDYLKTLEKSWSKPPLLRFLHRGTMAILYRVRKWLTLSFEELRWTWSK